MIAFKRDGRGGARLGMVLGWAGLLAVAVAVAEAEAPDSGRAAGVPWGRAGLVCLAGLGRGRGHRCGWSWP